MVATCTKLGNANFALRDLIKTLELDENFHQAYYNCGTLLARLEKSKQAEKDLTKAKALA